VEEIDQDRSESTHPKQNGLTKRKESERVAFFHEICAKGSVDYRRKLQTVLAERKKRMSIKNQGQERTKNGEDVYGERRKNVKNIWGVKGQRREDMKKAEGPF